MSKGRWSTAAKDIAILAALQALYGMDVHDMLLKTSLGERR
jgi:hypothetical protein